MKLIRRLLLVFLFWLATTESLLCQHSFSEQRSNLQAVVPKPANTQFGNYTLQKWLGSGDQAIVYKALDAKQKVVALKAFYTKSQLAKVHPERKKIVESLFTQDGTSLACLAEYQASQLLDHPSIMKIYRKERIEDVTFLVMEYVKGKSLNQMKNDSLSQEQAKMLAKQLLSALRYAFSRGLIHDDLWSENIFIDEQNNLKLIDVGSFDFLPVMHKKEKPKGRYREYQIVVVRAIKELLQLGKFSKAEQEVLFAKIDDVAKKSDNCFISYETKDKIDANLQQITRVLS